MTKYEEFKNKKNYIASNWGMKCDTEHLWKLVDEMLCYIQETEELVDLEQKVLPLKDLEKEEETKVVWADYEHFFSSLGKKKNK